MSKIAFFRPSVDEKEEEVLKNVLSAQSVNQDKVLEAEFSKFIGSEYAITTSNGTAALHLAMCALDLKRGDKVICSVNAYPSVPEVVRHFDAEPILVDVNKDNYTLNLDKLEEILSKNTSKKLKAVIFTHIGGKIADLDRLYAIASKYKIKVVEDASESLGSIYKGKKIGSSGADITTFTFSSHLKANVAKGGMLVTDDDALYERALLLRNHGIEIKGMKDTSMHYVYDVVDIGCNYGMGDIESSYALAQLGKLESQIERHKEITAVYETKLNNLPHITLPTLDSNDAHQLYIIKIDRNRDGFARELEKRGIETGLHYIPLHLLTYYKEKYSLRVNDFPISLQNYQQMLSIPLYADLSNEEVDYICEQIADVASHWV